jgi:ribosomal protein L34E
MHPKRPVNQQYCQKKQRNNRTAQKRLPENNILLQFERKKPHYGIRLRHTTGVK